MRHRLLLLLLLFAMPFVQAQTPFADALELARYVDSATGKLRNDLASRKAAATVLKPYIVADTDPALNDIFAYLTTNVAENPNYNPILARFIPAAVGLDNPLIAGKTAGGSLLGSIGGLDVTTFADGMARFIVDRAKEEFNVAFFRKLQQLHAKYPEFSTLFPRTNTFLSTFQPWDYANVIITVREAFDKDLKNLLPNVLQLRSLGDSACGGDKDCLARIATLRRFFSSPAGRITFSSITVAQGFLDQQKIPDILHTITDSNALGQMPGLSADGRNALQLVDILSLSLRSPVAGQSYVSTSELERLFANDVQRSLYIGLLLQQVKTKNIRIGSLVIADRLQADYEPFRQYLNRLVSGGTQLLNAYNKLKEARAAGSKDLNDQWVTVFAQANELLQGAVNLEIITPRISVPAAFTTVLGANNRLLEIAHDVAVRNYNAAVLGALSFLQEQLPKNDSTQAFLQFFSKYGSFAANVVHAQSSDQVQLAIKAIALPSGSASIKKNAKLNIALNSYLGLFSGTEFLAANSLKRAGRVTGLTAPVGLSISTRIAFGSKKDANGSISLFLPLIDVGAFASFRLKDSTTADLPKVTLQNIFSPGIGLVLGAPYVPLSVGYMHQFGPALREITPSAATNAPGVNHRGIFFIAVDIPLLNFYNNAKDPKRSK